MQKLVPRSNKNRRSNLPEKMQKLVPKRNKNRLGNLPDSIRSRIVSFLPTEEAARTSILSRQWRYVCSSLSCLDFNLLSYANHDSKSIKPRFKNYVDKMLASHDGTVLEIFSISVKVDTKRISPAKLGDWISAAVRHKVQNLHLAIKSGFSLTLPSVFTCSTVTKLVLVDVYLQLPGVITLPSLKFFRLQRVRFPSDVTTIDRVFSSSTCPVLEELEISDCYLNRLSISLPCIKRARLYIPHPSMTFNLSIPNVRELIWKGRGVDISYDTFSALRIASFDTIDLFDFESHLTTKILCGVCNVEKLTLKNSFIQILSRDKDLPKSVGSVTFAIKHLHLHMFLREPHMDVMYFLLPKFRELQTLHVVAEGHYGRDKYWKPVDWVPKEEPVHENLKRVVLRKFRGMAIEVEFVNYLFRSAKVLELIDICCSEDINHNTEVRVAKKLRKVRGRASKKLRVRWF